MPKTRKLTLMAMLTALSLIVFVIEAQIPAPVPIPGVKLGIANMITLVAMLVLGRREAGLILLVRIILGSVFAGSVTVLPCRVMVSFAKNTSGSFLRNRRSKPYSTPT